MKANKKTPPRTRSQSSQKSQSRATAKSAPARTRRYDPEMIRDFLMQLRIELKNDQLARAKSGATVGESAGELEAFLRKHGTNLLYKISFGEVSDDQQAEIDRTMASARKRQLEALEFLLETAFKEALTCAAEQQKPGSEKSITFSADDWTKWTRNGSS
jgi:hypothetical protein